MADCLVRGLKAPRSCAACNSDLAATVNCIYTQRLVLPEEHDMRAGRHPSCPLVPLPEKHGRLGDLDALEKELAFDYAYAAAKVCHNAPTIIPAEGGGEYGNTA